MTEEQYNEIIRQISTLANTQSRIIKKLDNIQDSVDKLERNHHILASEQDKLMSDVRIVKKAINT